MGKKRLRKEVDSHLKKACPLEVIECEFSFAGCGAQMQRQIMSKHMEDSVGKHLSTLAAYLKEPTAHRQSKALQGEDQAGKSRQVEDEMSDKMKHLEDKLEKQGEQMKQQQVKIELQEKRTEQQREFIKQQEDQIKQMKGLLEQQSDQVTREVIWVDPNVNNMENTRYVQHLKQVPGISLLATTSTDEALLFLQRKKPGTEYRAMTAGRGGEQFVTRVRDCGIHCRVLVFCGAVEYHKTWAKKFDKTEVTDSVQEMIKFATWKD